MAEVPCRQRIVYPVPRMGRMLVGHHRPSFYLRCLYHQENQVAVVERGRRSRTLRHVVGRCPRLCPRRRLFHQSLFLPELRHPLQLLGEITAHGRLPLRQQGELRTAHPADTPHHALDPAYTAHRQLQVVYRVAPVGLPSRQGIRTGAAQRHRRLQLSRRRHHLCRLAL